MYVQRAFRDDKGKSTSEIVEILGSLEDVRSRAGGQDPIEWAKKYVKQLTAEVKEGKRDITVRLSQDRLIEKGVRQCYNCGYLFLSLLYHQLGLDRICSAIAKRFKFEYKLDDILQVMVFGRILNPASKLATHGAMGDYLQKFNAGLHDVYRSLDVICKEEKYIQRKLFLNSRKVVDRDTTILYYDCTNYFFEIEEPDPTVVDADGNKTVGLRQYGVSKEHRPNPVVQMGLFVDKSGLPLAMNINPGNTNEQTTLIPLEKDIIEGMGVERIVVCTDGGLSSEDNRSFNSTAERSFITVQSLKKLDKSMTEWALQNEGWKIMPLPGKEEGDIVVDLSKDETAKLYGGRTFYRERWIKNDNTGFEQRLIVTFSYKYRDYLRWIRARQIARAEIEIKKGTSGKRRPNSPKRFIQEAYATKDGEAAVYKTMALNMDAISDEEKYDGFYGICTDLNNPAPEILRLNHERWEAEDAFRVLKTDFKARPAFVWTDEHIRAHFLICFIALLIYRILEKKVYNHLEADDKEAFTANKLLGEIRKMRVNYVKGVGYKPDYTRTNLTDAMHKWAGFRTDTEIVTQAKIKKIVQMVKES